MRTAYLVSRYPAVNHTFILREIRTLRSSGMDLCIASVLPCDRANAALSPDEREEAASTFYVRAAGLIGFATAKLSLLFTRPGAYFRGFSLALRLSRWNIRTALRHLLYLSEATVVGRWMALQGASHLHTHFASTPALLVAAMFPVTMSMTIHGPDEFNDAVGFLLPEKVEAATFVMAISSYGASQIMRVSRHEDWDKIHVARLGVDISEFSPKPALEGVRGELEIICVGRLAPAKAQLILLRACELLIRRGRKVRLRLVGDGPDRRRLEAAAAHLGITGRVIFEGALSHDRVLELYRAADLFVLASFAEGVPVVLMEAMAMEIPCVATRITGVPELIEHGVSGLLVPPADAVALADAVETLLDDPALRASLGKAAREKILREYDLHVNMAKVRDLFHA